MDRKTSRNMKTQVKKENLVNIYLGENIDQKRKNHDISRLPSTSNVSSMVFSESTPMKNAKYGKRNKK